MPNQPLIIHQAEFSLPPLPRGFHLVTDRVLRAIPEIRSVRTGLLSVFLKHTSASLSLNENADPDVRRDMEAWANQAAPDGARLFVHTLEGADDMPAHVKSGLFGASLTLPVTDGRLNLGTWQGIWLGEHRGHATARSIVLTLFGI